MEVLGEWPDRQTPQEALGSCHDWYCEEAPRTGVEEWHTMSSGWRAVLLGVVFAPYALVLDMAEGIKCSGAGLSLRCTLSLAPSTTRPWHDELRLMREGEASLMVGHQCPEDPSKSTSGKLC